jgi:hypothetical protein
VLHALRISVYNSIQINSERRNLKLPSSRNVCNCLLDVSALHTICMHKHVHDLPHSQNFLNLSPSNRQNKQHIRWAPIVLRYFV